MVKYLPAELHKRYGLTDKQKIWADIYLSRGGEAATKATRMQCERQLARPNMQAYLDERRAQIKKKAIDTSGFLAGELIDTQKVMLATLRTLDRIINICLPPGETNYKKVNVNGAMSAISERNRMLGLYAPEKSINLQMEIDSRRIIEAVNTLSTKYEKEF